jgi:hypothetical protein
MSQLKPVATSTIDVAAMKNVSSVLFNSGFFDICLPQFPEQ